MNPDAQSGNPLRSAATESTSSSLIERARQREQEAWDRMAVLYGPMVYRWCRRFGLRAEDAADTVQEVFLVVVDAIGDFRGGRKGTFRSWLRTVTRNKTHDAFRRAAGQASAVGGSAAHERLSQLVSAVASSDEQATDDGDDVWDCAVERVRAEFPSHVWKAFWRVTIDGVAAADAADELGMSVAAVYQAKSRVLRRLRQDLRDLEVGE